MAIWQVDFEFDLNADTPLSEVEEYWVRIFGEPIEVVPGFFMYGPEVGSRVDLCPPKEGEVGFAELIARVDCRERESMQFCEELVRFAAAFGLTYRLLSDEKTDPLPLDAKVILRLAVKIFKSRLDQIPGL